MGDARAHYPNPAARKLLLGAGYILRRYPSRARSRERGIPKRSQAAQSTHDAYDVADELKKIGFSVANLIDAKFEDLHDALIKFTQQTRVAEIAIVYYAGHGIEVGG